MKKNDLYKGICIGIVVGILLAMFVGLAIYFFAPTLKDGIFYCAVAVLMLAAIMAGLSPAPRDDTPVYTPMEEFRQNLNFIYTMQSSWCKSLSTASTLILTGCGVYFFLYAKEFPLVKMPAGILAVTATVNLASAMLLHLAQFFMYTWTHQSHTKLHIFLYNLNYRALRFWHLPSLICIGVQIFTVLYIILTFMVGY